MALFASSFNKPSGGNQQASFANPFSSAFAPGTAPVVDPKAGNRHNKRKRSSEASQQQQNRAAAYSDRDTVKSAQQNIEKLMKVLDKGSLDDKKGGKDKSRKKRKSVGGADGDDGAITMDELRRRLAAEESGDDASGGRDDAGPDGKQQPKKKKIKHGLDGRPILPPGVSSIAELQGKGKSPKAKTKQPQQASKPKQPQQSKKAESASTAAIEPISGEWDEDVEDEKTEVPAVTKPMTSLQSSLVNKLSSAKFRWLNEQLYTLPSTEAWDMMRKEGGSAFADYHDSHRQQTAAWPSPPLPYIVSAIRKLAEASRSGSNMIVDLGCGDASLAKELNGVDGFTVLSYDLVGDVQYLAGSEAPTESRGWVVPGDFLDSVPLPGEPGGHEHAQDGFEVKVPHGTKKKGKKNAEKPPVMTAPQVVDSVVCCLSLMGVNWVGGIYEACRILKTGGTFHVAEVTSRLISNKEFIKLVESFGFRLEEHTAPTTHFDLFRFTKTSFAPLGVVKGQWAWDARVAEGTKIMKGCVYKKR
ncbi:hypothetical protein QFC19_002929 [Naganishia cerealis]|uniref:Uncharacterized protein n=1 Tax=Naganishia cerealis TaxID=610337 RepID=A0ACC2W7A0_9TREE|nr:hypothetical protein QFC19_002929 [Naganishia cerealis]